ncbi:MAG: YfiR family protein [Noviherbaspirillum sp.]
MHRRTFGKSIIGRLAPALLCAALALAPARAQPAVDSAPASALEMQVIAASLFRFLGYVEWPPQALPPGAPYVIGIIGADAIAEELAAVAASRTINERAVMVRRLKPGEQFDGVHELFVSGTVASRQQAIQAARQLPALIVTHAEGALDRGSMINFRLVDGRLRFEVALDAMDEAGLKVSSRMLSVALHVRKSQGR